MIGNPEEIAEKILNHSQALGGISRFTFQMDNAELSNKQLLKSIELIGKRTASIIRN
jgi:alkanesulfonate monooxygenase SsuD/methylene tetrahydromethanopterin reductase-like flavin-dependent oxidoreductase (luciferase family)